MLRRLATKPSLHLLARNSLSHPRIAPISLQAALRCSDKPVKKEGEDHLFKGVPKHQVRPIDRFFLVMTGAYKRMEDVPSELDRSTIAKAQNKRRIFTSIFLCFFTVVGCYVAFKRGKYVIDNKLEDGLVARNLKRDARNRAAIAEEKARKEAEEKAAAESN